MIEKHIVLEDIDPVAFFGVGNGHLQMLKSLYPKLRIVARGNVIRLLGDEEEMARFEESVSLLRKHLLKYNQLGEEDILDIVKGRLTKADGVKGVLVYSMSGRPIKPRSANQQELIDAYERNDMVFAVGPAGTGKTYLSIALAVKALKEKTAKKQIQIAPLAFMRGRTLSDAVVILDEAQNTTPQQIRMFLTRMGWNTKMIITGDMTQIDLPRGQKSGLREALSILGGVEGIGVVELTKKDIVRHKLVTRIVNAYEAYDKAAESGKKENRLKKDISDESIDND